MLMPAGLTLAALPVNAVIFGSKAYDISLLNDTSVVNEILAAFVANGNTFFFKNPVNVILDPNANTVSRGVLPVITYKDAQKRSTRYAAGDGDALPAVTVTLSNTASGIGKIATVTAEGYTAATQFRLLASNGAILTDKVSMSTRPIVLALTVGQTCSVELYSSGGSLLETFNAVASVAATSRIILGETPSGIGHIATVDLTGYTGVAQYRLLKASDNTALTGMVNAGQRVVIMLVEVGDLLKLEVYNASGVLMATESAVAQAAPTPPGGTGTVTVALSNRPSGIGKLATVTLTGYTGAAKYQLLKAADNTALTDQINVGITVVVMFLYVGDQCKVQVYDGDGNLIETKTVVAQ